MDLKEALILEENMWKAAQGRDPKAFLDIVSPDAIMVCGGFRCTGAEYAEVIREFDCKAYGINNFEIVNEDADSFQTHYILTMEVSDERNLDLAGTFHITTTWHREGGCWKVRFNMDQRVV